SVPWDRRAIGGSAPAAACAGRGARRCAGAWRPPRARDWCVPPGTSASRAAAACRRRPRPRARRQPPPARVAPKPRCVPPRGKSTAVLQRALHRVGHCARVVQPAEIRREHLLFGGALDGFHQARRRLRLAEVKAAARLMKAIERTTEEQVFTPDLGGV